MHIEHINITKFTDNNISIFNMSTLFMMARHKILYWRQAAVMSWAAQSFEFISG